MSYPCMVIPLLHTISTVRMVTRGEKLFAYALHDTVPEIKKEVMRGGEWVKIPDEEAMQEVATKIQEIRGKFNAWLDSRLSPSVTSW